MSKRITSVRNRTSALLLIAAMLPFSGCTGPVSHLTTTGSPGAAQTGDGSPITPPRAAWDSLYDALRSGYIYLLVGPPGSGNVWKVALSQQKATQLTHNPDQYGVSWISASAAGLVLADASSGIDVVSMYRGGKSEPLPAGHAFTPAISADGTLAYVDIPDVVHHPEQAWGVSTADVSGAGSSTIYQQQQPMGGLAWGPNNELAVLSAPTQAETPTGSGPPPGPGGSWSSGTAVPAIAPSGGTPRVLILTRHGSVVRSVTPDIGAPGYVAWGPTAPALAIGDPGADIGAPSNHAELIHADGSQTPLPSGWTPQCWSPDGSELVMTRGDTMGVFSPGSNSGVTTVATDLTVGGCSWLSQPAANT